MALFLDMVRHPCPQGFGFGHAHRVDGGLVPDRRSRQEEGATSRVAAITIGEPSLGCLELPMPVRALDLDATSGTLVGLYWKADHVKGKNSGSSIVRATMLNLTRSGFASVRVSPLWTISVSRCHSRGGHVAASTMPNEKCK